MSYTQIDGADIVGFRSADSCVRALYRINCFRNSKFYMVHMCTCEVLYCVWYLVYTICDCFISKSSPAVESTIFSIYRYASGENTQNMPHSPCIHKDWWNGCVHTRQVQLKQQHTHTYEGSYGIHTYCGRSFLSNVYPPLGQLITDRQDLHQHISLTQVDLQAQLESTYTCNTNPRRQQLPRIIRSSRQIECPTRNISITRIDREQPHKRCLRRIPYQPIYHQPLCLPNINRLSSPSRHQTVRKEETQIR